MTTRDRIVDSARQLFWEQGFATTSLARIADRSGALPGSIYYCFKTKEAILHAVLDLYASSLRTWLIDPVFAATSDPLERVFGIVNTYREFLVETQFTLGCPVGKLAIELGEEHLDARKRVAALFAELRGVVTECLDRLSDRLPPDPPPSVIAGFTLTVIEGGIVQARVARDIAPFDESVRCLKDYYQRLLG